MAKSVPALINPAMLIWAREKAGMDLEAAAKAATIPPEKLASAEAGEAHLTFSQLMKAARAYKRPVSLFYLSATPTDWQPIQDFRLLHDAEAGQFSPKLLYAIRQAQERRELALELKEELGEPVREFTLSAGLDADPEALGRRIREYLGVIAADQQTWRAKAFDNWRHPDGARR